MPKPERTERSRALIGGLIILGLLGLVVLIVSLDDLLRGREQRVRIVAALEESDGVVPGSPVWLAGRAVGEVELVTFAPPERPGPHAVLATLSLPAEHLDMVRTDSRVRLTSPRLMGNPVVEVLPGSAGAPHLAAGDTLRESTRPGMLDSLSLQRARGLIGDARAVGRNLKVVDSLFARRAPALDQVRQRMQLAAAEMDRLSLQLEQGPLARLGEARVQERIERIRQELGTVAAGLQRYGAGELGAGVDSLMTRAGTLAASLDTIQALADEPRGVLGRMAADSALAVQIRRTQAQLDSLLAETRANPLRYFF